MTAPAQTTYTVAGMTCGHCEASVREEVETVSGVLSATAERASGTLVVVGDAEPAAIAQAVQAAGYEVVA